MIGNAANPLLFIVTTLLDFALGVLLLRIMLQAVRADFFNPISQLVWKLTQPVVGRLARIVPRWRNLDLAAVLVAVVLAIIYIRLVASLDVSWRQLPWDDTLKFAVLKLVSLALNLYTLSLFAATILSWVGPGVANPAANVLWSINEPLLKPVRRILPPIAGLDLSPLPVMLILQAIDRYLQPFLGPFN